MKKICTTVAVILALVLLTGGFALANTDTPSPEPVEVTGVNLNVSSMTLVAGGQNGILRASIRPVNATDQRLIWTSSNTSVATVTSSSDAVVTPLSAGTATITVRTRDGSFTDTCVVTVRASTTPALPATGGGTGALVMGAFGLAALAGAVPVVLKSRRR